MPDFVHLHLHTEYSLLDGFARTDRLFEAVLDKGMDTVAVTDHGVMFGAVEFYKKATEAGVRPIIGCEIYLAEESGAPGAPESGRDRHHLVLLVKNETGYHNLVRLVSLGFTEGFYYKPRVSLSRLRECSEGLICLSSCIQGAIPSAILEGDMERAMEHARVYRDIFGEDFYLELQNHGLPEQQRTNRGLLYISDQLGLPVVATNDVHYIERSDAAAHDVLLCIQTGKNRSDTERMRFPCDEFYLKSPEEMEELFREIPEAIENTRVIADKCRFAFRFGELHLPAYPDGIDLRELTNRLLREQIEQGFPYAESEVRERLDAELDTIYRMGYEDYFLIVRDFIHKAREMGITVGPGRGSVAGSLVAWVLGITEVDPIRHGLIFERFLNTQRVTMPDIDVDFEDERRHEVIEYVKRKYGEDRVAQIITFGTLAARAAFRDAARVMELPYAVADKVAKEIPHRLGISLDAALRENSKLAALLRASEEVAEVYEIARSIEGVPRHASTHAAGVLITRDAVYNHVPLYLGNTTQYTMKALERLGLLKMDFLGIRTLTVVKNATAMASERSGRSVVPDRQDGAVYDMISSGCTVGLFQLESTGFRRFIREMKPRDFEDLVAAISLYRPGPMESIPQYLANRADPSRTRYAHPKLEPILSVTHGVLIYQEQVMRITRDLAGYDYGRSDILRDAMGKKKMDVMLREHEVFVDGLTHDDGTVAVPGCVRGGVPREVAERLFEEMEEFAKYAFNKSHAVGYAMLAYRTAYLKCFYPVEYMASLLSTVPGFRGMLTRYINECLRMRIPVRPPSVNRSEADFVPEDGAIRFGLLAIKNVGRGVAAAVVETRRTGDFTSFHDFIDRMPRAELNKKAVESLIYAGAFDEFGARRTQLIAVYDALIDDKSAARGRNEAQISLFQVGAIDTSALYAPMPELPEYPPETKLLLEKEVLGVYLSGHPLDPHKELCDALRTMTLSELREAAQTDVDSLDRTRFVLPGLVLSKREQSTRKGERMAFLMVEDFDDQIEVVLFPKAFAQYRGEDKVLIRGTLQLREDEEPKLIADSIAPLAGNPQGDTARSKTGEGGSERGAQPVPTIYLRFRTDDTHKLERVESLLRAMSQNRRSSASPYRVVYYLEGESRRAKTAYRGIFLDIAQKREIEDRIGPENYREK